MPNAEIGPRSRSSPSCSLARPAVAAERLLVVPLENNRDEPSIYWLSEASAILLADNLNSLGVSAITRPERVRAFETLHLPPSATLDAGHLDQGRGAGRRFRDRGGLDRTDRIRSSSSVRERFGSTAAA